MKKYIVFVISLVIFFVYYIVVLKKNNYDSSNIVSYDFYDKAIDFEDLDNLMVKYQFWLFHGQTFKKGDCPLYKNFESKMHSDDFDTNLQVPYYIKVARIGNHCVGFITYYISERRTEEKNGDIKKLGRIHLLCVDEKYRRLGIAHYLMSNVIDYFKENKCDRVYLITRPENSRAKSLYYKLGFVVTSNNEEVDVFDRDPAIILVKDI